MLFRSDVVITGHAIECRINAENPLKNFRPCAGTIEGIHFPGGRGVRIESSVYGGYTVPPVYDSMLAKIITYGANRQEAIATMRRALSELVIEGIDTNVSFQFELLHTEAFEQACFDTSFIEKNLSEILAEVEV